MNSERRTPGDTPSPDANRGEAAAGTIVTHAESSPEFTARRDAIVRGLSRIWPDDSFTDGELVLFDARTKQSRRVSTLVAAATALALGLFAYLSCALFRLGSTGRLARDAVAIPGVWLDLDTKGGAHKKQNLPTRDEALAFVAKLPLQPTFILFSGGGLYCWWCFAELWVFDSDAERTRAARLVAGWQAFIRDLAAVNGWHVDSTGTLAQVLRPEGGLNEKYSPAREVECIADGGPVWNPSDFEEWIDLAAAPRGSKSKAPQCASGPLPADELRTALTHIDCAAMSYEQWRNVGFGLHHYSGGSDAGFALWDEWSSRDPGRYECTAALRKLWSGFGRSDDRRRPVTILSVVALARAGGWRGELPDPSLVESLPVAGPTRPVVRDIQEAIEQVREVALDFAPGTQSLHVQSWPGCGKTSTFGQVAIERIAAGVVGWESGAVLAVPERALVHEKAHALAEHAQRMAVPVRVRMLLGRSPDPASGWWCERHEKASLNSELGRRACSRCPLKGSYERGPDSHKRVWVDGVCATERGRYLHAREMALEPGGLLVTTIDALAHAYREIDEQRVLMLDDAGPLLGLDRVVELRSIDAEDALNRTRDWRERMGSPPLVHGAVLPDVHVAEVPIEVLRALTTRGRDRTQRVEAHVGSLHAVVQSAVRADAIEPPRDDRGSQQPWPWEVESYDDGPDGSPAFTALCLDVAREVIVHGHGPIVERVDRRAVDAGGADLRIHLPDRELIKRAKAGRVVWLSVAPIPAQVAEALGVRREVLHADPRHLELVVGELEVPFGDRGRTRRVVFGPGKRQGGAPSAEDTLSRAIAKAMADSRPSFGAVLLKADREALGSPDWCRSYGAGHAGSDELAGREWLLVRRFVPPYAALALDACLLRRALGLDGALIPPSSTQVKTVREKRQWRPDLGVIPTVVPADPLERELLRAVEAHGILNAIGRSRALSADGPRFVLALDGRPFETLGAAITVEPLRDVLARLGVLERVEIPDRDARDAALAQAQARRADKRAKRRQRLQELLDQNPRRSTRALARRLKCSERTITNDLGAIGCELRDPLQDAFEGLRRAARSANRSKEEYLCIVLPDLAAPAVAGEIERASRVQLSQRTVRGHLAALRRALRSGAALVLPKRSDARQGLLAVTQAAVRLLERRRGEPRRRGASQLELPEDGGAS